MIARDESVGGRGHRFEATELAFGGCIYLEVGIAAVEIDLQFPAAARQRHGTRARQVVQVIELPARKHHLISERELSLMKPTAYLINTSRGPIVDEHALVRALIERRIAGAGLDVFEHEPGINPALLGLSNTVITPHMGSAVATLRAAMADAVVDNIVALLDGRQPPNCWNKEIYST